MTDDVNTFLHATERAFEGEIDSGALTVVESRYSPREFGNAVVILEGGGLRLKLNLERSKSYALLASAEEPQDWVRLQTALSAATNATVAGSVEPVGWELSPADAASLFREHRTALSEAFAANDWPSTKKKLDGLRSIQQQRLVEWLASEKSDADRDERSAAARALENPSDELKAALKSLGLER